MAKGLMKMNLQFFADGGNDNDDNDINNPDNGTTDIGGGDGNSSGSDGVGDENIDYKAFADLISEKDKELEQLRTEVDKLKKSNAELIVKVSAGAKHSEKTFEDNLLGLVGAKPRKE